MALAGASAEDVETEYIRKLCEVEVFSGKCLIIETLKSPSS